MEMTFKVEAKCNIKSGINVEFKGLPSIDHAVECAAVLVKAFPQVDVVCEQTGEVLYSQYIAVDYFHPQMERAVAILQAECDLCF